MAQMLINTVNRAGIELSGSLGAASNGGDTWPNTGAEYVALRNESGAPITVTFVFAAIIDGQTVANKTVVVAANDVAVLIGPFPVLHYNNASGLASATYSTHVNLKIGVFRNAIT